MSIKMNKGSSYPPIERELNSTDRLIVSQSGYKTQTGFRTGLVTVPKLADYIFQTLEENIKNMVYIDNRFLTGAGSVDDPIVFNSEWVTSNFVNANMANLSQIGDLRSSLLPIGVTDEEVRATTAIPFLLCGVVGHIVPGIIFKPFSNMSGDYTAYVYLGLRAKKPNITYTSTLIAERVDFTLIAKVFVKSGKAVNVEAKPFIRLGRYRISDTPCGSAMLSAPGPAAQYNFTDWD